MNKTILNLLFALFALPVLAEINGSPSTTQVIIKDKKHFTEVNPPADMPDVYYNSELGVITIVDYVNATYYVTIIDDWNNIVLTDTKIGGGTIDVSSLSTGDYTIDITTSWNHEFTGDFFVP